MSEPELDKVFIDSEWSQNKVLREPNEFLYAQRALKHKISIYYKSMQNLFIENTASSLFLEPENFSNNIFDEIGVTNSNNATNLNQLYSENTYSRNITLDKYFYLDGKTTFESGVWDEAEKNNGLKLLGKNYSNETVDVIGWMSRTVCDDKGYFVKPVRLIHEFKADQSIVRWLIRSVSNEVPVDFSVCIYDKDRKMIYKSKLYKNNSDNRIELDINRGLCRYIELRITRWGIKDSKADGGVVFKSTEAKIVYFFHHAAFPKGITDYKNSDLLQSFNVSEYLCSSIGKANYGVQSNTGQFTLININKLFDTLKSTGYLKNGLKVEYYVCVDKYFQPKIKD